MKKLKVAIIGAGQITQVTHIPIYQTLADEVEIIGICDVNYDLALSVANQNNIPNVYGSYEEMFDNIQPDAVSICVPNRFHCATTCYALSKGCHVLCEKPPALSVEETNQMVTLAKETNQLLTFNFHFRHAKEVEILKDKISKNELGNIYGARVQWLRRRGIPGWGNFINKEMQGGGPLIDIGIHMLDTTLYLMDFPEIDYISATSHQQIGTRKGIGLMGDWDPNKFTVEDAVFGFIKFKNGASLSLETSFALNIKEKDVRSVHLFGSMAGASVFPLEIYGEDEFALTETKYPFVENEDRHLKSIKNFVNACLCQTPLVCKSSEALYIQKVIDGLYQSASTGMPFIFESEKKGDSL